MEELIISCLMITRRIGRRCCRSVWRGGRSSCKLGERLGLHRSGDRKWIGKRLPGSMVLSAHQYNNQIIGREVTGQDKFILVELKAIQGESCTW